MRSRPKRSRVTHWVIDGVGVTLVAVGGVGVVVPGLPTTIFWIGAVACFLKTRPWAVRPLLKTPVVGSAIIGFLRWRPLGGGRKPGSPAALDTRSSSAAQADGD